MTVGLELYAEVQSADGARYLWDDNQPVASRLQNVQITTKLGEGFSTLTGNLARRVDLDYPDLRLGQFIVVVGADGHVVFEGRLTAMPREVADAHSISVTFVGHMAHAADRRFSEIYVDRDISGWVGPSLKRRSSLIASGAPFGMINDGAQGVDPTNNQAGIITGFDGAWVAGFRPIGEAWYDAGPDVQIGQLTYSWLRLTPATVGAGPDNFTWTTLLSTDDVGTVNMGSGDLQAAGPVSNASFVSNGAAVYRWAMIQFYFNGSPGGAAGTAYQILWYKLAVYGTHGLTLTTGEPGEPPGVTASDVLKDVAARFCPYLNTNGVQSTDYVIQHLKFHLAFPHDAFLEVNKYHLNHLAVWEGRTLTFRPYDLSTYQWEIRTDDPGVTFSPVGLSAEELFNGITVVYKDILTGRSEQLSPDVFTDLQDTSVGNPWNEWGIQHWDLIELSAPTVQNQAIQIGRAALADKNRPKTPGTMTVTGYIRDRAGNQQPASYPRAGDVICITNFNEINRLIVETAWDAEAKQMKIAVDLPFQLLEALFDRQANARQARGI